MRFPKAVAFAVIDFITDALLDNPKRVGAPLQGELEGIWSGRRGQQAQKPVGSPTHNRRYALPALSLNEARVMGLTLCVALCVAVPSATGRDWTVRTLLDSGQDRT